MQNCTEIHDGLFILGGAKKVLFPEAVDVGVGMSKTAPSSSTSNPNERRKVRSRARLATSSSMLANIPSDISESTGAVALKVRAHAVGEGKENRAPKTSGKRGNNIKLDSLAMAFPNKGEIHSKRFLHGSIENKKLSSENVSRKSKGKGLSYAKIDVNTTNVQRHDRRLQVIRDASEHKLGTISGSSNPSSTIALQNKSSCNKSGTDNQFTLSKKTNGMARQSNESIKEKSKRFLGPSSLMMLPSSTQKAQRPTISTNAVHRKKPVSSRTTSDKKCVGNHLPPSSNPPSLGNMIYANNVNITNLAGTIDNTCSTPLSGRQRKRLGSITSPPGFNFFHDYSPRPDSNPNSMKRFDGKKTPDNKSGALSTLAPEVPSSIASVATMSLSPIASEEERNNEAITIFHVDEDQDCINGSSSVASINSPISYSCSSNMFPSISCQQEHETSHDNFGPELFETESSEAASSYFFKRVSSVETNLPDSMSDTSHRAPLHDRNATAQTKDKPTKCMAPTRPRVLNKEGEATTEVRRSSRSSKPTDRLMMQSWNKKKKPLRSDNIGSKDGVNTNKEKPLVQSDKKGSVDKVSKNKSIQTRKKEAFDENIEDGADWASYQSYIQSLLTRNRQGQN